MAGRCTSPAIRAWPSSIRDRATPRDQHARGANPWWIALSPDGRTLAVAVSPTWPSFSISGAIVLLMRTHSSFVARWPRSRASRSRRSPSARTVGSWPTAAAMARRGSSMWRSGEQLVSAPRSHHRHLSGRVLAGRARRRAAAGDGRAYDLGRRRRPEAGRYPPTASARSTTAGRTSIWFPDWPGGDAGVPHGPYTNKQVIETFSSVTGERLSPPLVVGPTSNFVRLSLDGRSALSDQ